MCLGLWHLKIRDPMDVSVVEHLSEALTNQADAAAFQQMSGHWIRAHILGVELHKAVVLMVWIFFLSHVSMLVLVQCNT